MSDRMNERKPSDLEPTGFGRYEMNLCEYPIALIRKDQPGDEPVVFREEVRDQVTSRTVVREVRIEPNPRYGYPTERDGDVLIALMSLSKRDYDFAEKTVRFTREQLRKVMRW